MNDSSGETLGVDQTLHITAPKNPREIMNLKINILAMGPVSSQRVDPVPDVGFHSGLMNEVGR